MGFRLVVHQIGRMAAAPVVVTTRAAKKKMESIVIRRVLALLVRHALTAIGGATLAVSDNEVEAIVGALITLGGIAHSIYEKRQGLAEGKTPTAET